MATLMVYLVVFFLCTELINITEDNLYMIDIFSWMNLIIMILGFSLFLYTIIMMRKAHAASASFKISNKGTYIVCSLYAL